MRWFAGVLWLLGIAASQVSATSYAVPIAVSCLSLIGFLSLSARHLREQPSPTKWAVIMMALVAALVLADNLRRLVHIL